MLPNRSLQLLTAYVDGQLSSRQRRQVDGLLRRSEEARRVLGLLQQDSWHLQKLPRPALPSDLSGPILQTIAERGLTTARPRKTQRPAGVPFWKVFAAAAAILVVLGLGSYLYFASLPGPAELVAKGPEQQPGPSQERIQPPHLENKGVPLEQVAQNSTLPGSPQRNPPVKPQPTPEEKVKVVEGPKVKPPPVEPGKTPATPKETPGPVLADRGLEMFAIESVKLALLPLTPPQVLRVADLEQEPVQQKLHAELGTSNAFRLELPVQDSNRAVERLQAACKASGVNLIVDKLVQGRLTKPNWKTSYAFYLEGLTAADLARLMRNLAQVERQALAKKPPEATLDRLVIARMANSDWRDLAELLGSSFQPPAEQGNPKGEENKQAAKSQHQPGLVLTLPPVRPNRGSPEIKRFLDNRKPAQPGTLRVMIVVRNLG